MINNFPSSIRLGDFHNLISIFFCYIQSIFPINIMTIPQSTCFQFLFYFDFKDLPTVLYFKSQNPTSIQYKDPNFVSIQFQPRPTCQLLILLKNSLNTSSITSTWCISIFSKSSSFTFYLWFVLISTLLMTGSLFMFLINGSIPRMKKHRSNHHLACIIF
jgi:hypothetical protein